MDGRSYVAWCDVVKGLVRYRASTNLLLLLMLGTSGQEDSVHFDIALHMRQAS